MLKKFGFFAFSDYEASGGVRDLQVTFDTLDEFKAYVETTDEYGSVSSDDVSWYYERFDVVRLSDLSVLCNEDDIADVDITKKNLVALVAKTLVEL